MSRTVSVILYLYLYLYSAGTDRVVINALEGEWLEGTTKALHTHSLIELYNLVRPILILIPFHCKHEGSAFFKVCCILFLLHLLIGITGILCFIFDKMCILWKKHEHYMNFFLCFDKFWIVFLSLGNISSFVIKTNLKTKGYHIIIKQSSKTWSTDCRQLGLYYSRVDTIT